MQTAQELMKQIPEEGSQEADREWVREVLTLTPVEEAERIESEESKHNQVRLPELEAMLFFALVEKFGRPEHNKRANIPLLFLWELSRKYHMGLRYGTEVIAPGIFRYAVWKR